MTQAAETLPTQSNDHVGETAPDVGAVDKIGGDAKLPAREKAARVARELLRKGGAAKAAAKDAKRESAPNSATDDGEAGGEHEPEAKGEQLPPASNDLRDDEITDGEADIGARKSKKDDGKSDADAKAAAEKKAAAEREDLKASQKAEIRRRQKAAERHEREARAAEQRAEQRARELERRESQLSEFEQAFRKDPMGAVARRLGVPKEQLVTSYADEQANALPPEIHARFSQLETELKAEREERKRLEKQRSDAELEQRRDAAIRLDVDVIANQAVQKDGDDYPYFAALRRPERESRARLAVLAALQDKEEEYTRADILEALDERARLDFEDLMKDERIGRLMDGSKKGAPAAKGEQESRSRTPRSPTAKDGAAPAPKTKRTDAEAREAAAQAAREFFGRRR